MVKRERPKIDPEIRIGPWTIEEVLSSARVQGRGPAYECAGDCCRHGVYLSLDARDRILRHRERIQGLMDETQTTDVGAWFEDELHADPDFPGGECAGTDVHNGKCVFLNREGLCTLQIAESGLGKGHHLKPFYCRIFPLCTSGDRIEFDDLNDGRDPCCTLTEDGLTDPFEAYAYEFTEILGEAGYRALKARP